MQRPITLAIPKGRIYEELKPLMKSVGIEPEPGFFDSSNRALQFATNRPDLSIIRVRSFDVATFVARGGAQIGVVGSDVLEEFDYQGLYAPVNLDIGHCRLSIAEPVDAPPVRLHTHRRVATKYPNLTKAWFAQRGIQAECIKLNGAMELAPGLGLAEQIVDLVSTGNTLKANHLRESDVIMQVSSRLIVSRSALKTDSTRLNELIAAFETAVGHADAA
ncbi:MAG: ATP phosphoribosyltransferase [Rickettsiales bacterium]|nr:ATP phosphoribosyltransferase [Rickettsiales bacterium]|tara:strand:+ start:2747 stop:3403 length:657 start_codon:yes stop_codon:yes gene_type:complete